MSALLFSSIQLNGASHLMRWQFMRCVTVLHCNGCFSLRLFKITLTTSKRTIKVKSSLSYGKSDKTDSKQKQEKQERAPEVERGCCLTLNEKLKCYGSYKVFQSNLTRNITFALTMG